MHRIHYGAVAYLTGDEIARAVLDYAALLARSGDADVVALPVREPDGSLREVRLVLGAGLPIAATDIGPGNPEELHDDVLIADLDRRAAKRRHTVRSLTTEEMGQLAASDEDFLDY
ncbi:hypothetical protein [Agromyces sp. NPDC057865]|uniref:hypothetical protein n=1 Tax=Agromyces sp. NPDC057865 TaxID=3346267 RepID=UPI00366D6619